MKQKLQVKKMNPKIDPQAPISATVDLQEHFKDINIVKEVGLTFVFGLKEVLDNLSKRFSGNQKGKEGDPSGIFTIVHNKLMHDVSLREHKDNNCVLTMIRNSSCFYILRKFFDTFHNEKVRQLLR